MNYPIELFYGPFFGRASTCSDVFAVPLAGTDGASHDELNPVDEVGGGEAAARVGSCDGVPRVENTMM